MRVSTRAARHRLGLLAAPLVLLTLLGLLPGTASATTAPAPVAGGHSAGDGLFPTVGNSGYQVSHYSIRLGYASSGVIAASTTLTARASRPLSSYSLDLSGLTVASVTVDGHRSAFSRSGHKLVITPPTPVTGTFVTRVGYSGRPASLVDADGSRDGWIATSDGATVLSEPIGSMTWFPGNDTPADKATYSLYVSVPSALAVAANGDLRSRQSAHGRTTWHWEQTRPMATYLAMLSIGRYDVYHSTMTTTTGRLLPVWSFVQPSLGRASQARSLIPGVVRFHERRFGPYPFTSVGIVVRDLGVGYALETQNRPVFDGVPATSTLVHELAHQWYGDSVTPSTWQDIWLNEGFATYAEDLWTAAHGGRSTAAAFDARYAANPASSRLWSPAPARFDDPAALFGDPVYVRGGMMLQALRETIGDDAFATLLRRWAAQEQGRSTSTAQFATLAEQVSGADLGSFLDTWLYQPGRPSGY